MSFKRKLLIAFSIILITPMLLSAVCFYVIGNAIARFEGVDHLLPYSELSQTGQVYEVEAGNIFQEIISSCENDTKTLEDIPYLDSYKDDLSRVNSYIIVRKGKDIYYTGDPADLERIQSTLPKHAVPGDTVEPDISYYMNRHNRILKQYDFTFEDGDTGSLFVVTRVVPFGSPKLLWAMYLSMGAILIITALLLMQWLRTSMFQPMYDLNIAMNNIRDGNFDYVLSTNEKGEIGQLYQNYEDMRLRLKETTEEKIENEKHDRELISNISHDLKTPITAIKGYVEGLIDGVANTPEKQQKYLRTIYNKANDMNNLINELTLYSKIDNNKIPYNFQRINLADYFGDCVEEIGMDMESRGIELNYSNLVSHDTVIIADPEQLKRVINNIVSNSVKYMDKPRGRIDFRLLDEQDSVRIEIEDNGKGIAAKDLPNIFDRFFRTDSSRNSAQGGSGIGLSIVKKIVEDHGGFIWATSREGVGTCLHFVFRKYREQDKSRVDVDSSEE